MVKVLYVNHRKEQCGVYEFGKSIGNLITRSDKYIVQYCECNSFGELKSLFDRFKPEVIIYNFHPETMKWVMPASKYDAPATYKLNAIHIGTIHEVYQETADRADDEVFDFHVAPDPTLVLKNQIVFKTGRLLPRQPLAVENGTGIPVIGSFGFATEGKGFDKIVKLVQDEFDEAIIKLNIPFAKFGDETGENARRIAAECQKNLRKDSIRLKVDHNYLDDDSLFAFLSSNSINVFLYDDMASRGISSATDWALASGRPVAVSNSRLFRHLFNCRPSICVSESSLKSILENGVEPLQDLWNDWSAETILWEYERILSSALKTPSKSSSGKRNRLTYFSKKISRRIGLHVEEQASLNVWTKKDDKYAYQPIKYRKYEAIKLPETYSLNRILDNDARALYSPAVKFLEENLPELIAKKIPEANVQQAFVLDTAVRLSSEFDNPKILAVGAFEDTAVEALKLLGYRIDAIDPVLNYDLQTFITKPGTKAESYDLIVSTSVIEHVKEDEQFVRDMAYLLKKGGYAVLTCDYSDQYEPGDEIPDVDYRFYTQVDLKSRLMGAVPNCYLVTAPNWDCPNPDFVYLNRYQYTFATLVFKKS